MPDDTDHSREKPGLLDWIKYAIRAHHPHRQDKGIMAQQLTTSIAEVA